MMRLPLLLSVSFLLIGACGNGAGVADGGAGASGTAGGGGGSAGSAGSGGTTGAGGTTGSAGGGGTGGNAACASAVATQACGVEGTVCGGENCTNICQFCNLLRCTNGVWQPMEVAPAPCFACGNSGLQCQSYAEYCEMTIGGVPGSTPSYRCPATPAECRTAPSCSCLQSRSVPGSGSCTQAAAGQVTVTLAAP